MKKTILTLSIVALFSVVSKAQTAKTAGNATTAQPTKTVVNSDGTISTVNQTAPPLETTTPVKKSGTRMAINEKGLPGGSSTKKESAREEKSTAPSTQSGTSTKKN